MDWTNFENTDPNLLVGIVNTAIRNHYGNLQELCAAHAIDEQRLRKCLAEEDYEYNDSSHQFR